MIRAWRTPGKVIGTLRQLLFAATMLQAVPLLAADQYSFGVVTQRSAVVTAQYWNPILDYLRKRAGVELALKVPRTGGESADAAARGEYDFIFSNHIFQPRIAPAGYQVIARPRDEPISGQIVTLESSPIRDLADLAGREVGFPSKAAFVGYGLTMDALLRSKVPVQPVFGGNQEGIMAQLKAGRVAAIGVNGKLMQAYAAREGLRYRVLWHSEPYHDMPIAVHPRVPKAVAAAVRETLARMAEDAEGAAILAAAAAIVGQKPPFGFLPATTRDYQNYIDFYRGTLVQELR